MGFKELFIAIGLILILEGLIPFISPSSYKRALLQLKEIHDNYLRIVGLVLIILGVIILNLI